MKGGSRPHDLKVLRSKIAAATNGGKRKIVQFAKQTWLMKHRNAIPLLFSRR